MSEDDKINIEHCLYAINSIYSYLGEINTLEHLRLDHKTYDAILLNFLVLAESAGRLSQETKDLIPETDWKAIKAFRNFIAHDYFGVDENVVWAAIKYNLPILKEDLERITSN